MERCLQYLRQAVAPFVGVWIEICGEKNCPGYKLVAPFVGVWIEINQIKYTIICDFCRSLCGSVD